MKVKRSLFVTGLVLAVALLAVLVAVPVYALDRTVSQRVMKSVVQIVAADQTAGGGLRQKWGGSGSIISEDGLILTNCHVAMPRAMWDDPQFDRDVLIVYLTGRSDEPPEATFLAEVVQYDPDLDLAVLRVTSYVDGSPVDPKTLKLPALPVGDSDQLEIGDDIHIFGYPSIGGDTITLTSGNVSGFTREQGITGRAWIKTDATIAGGNSGGTAVTSQGELVGVPTQGGAGTAEEIVDCRHIADTNGDGVINELDSCVPMGGFINALRPVSLAKPMIEAAILGLGPHPTPTPKPTPRPTGKASVSRLLFAPAVNEANQPLTVVDSFPSGTNEIYLFFDYANFQDGTPWQPLLIYNGEVQTDTFPLSNWSGGPQGTWWISISNDPLPDGSYEFAFYYDDKELGSASVEVGGPEEDLPTFSDVAFAGDGTEGYLLPAGATVVTATFDYADMTSTTKWSYTWYYEGKKLSSGDGKSFSQASGAASLLLTNRQGFENGSYRLELYINRELAATSDFLIGGKKQGGLTQGLFGPITFAEGADRNDNPVRPHKPDEPFASGITNLYAFFDYQGMQDGWEWTRRWSIDDEVVVDSGDTWGTGESGSFWVNVYSDDALPDGKYQLDLLVEGTLVQSATCTIGKGGPGPTPTPTPIPQGERVEIYGRITDADTGKGIPGAVFIVLKPGITIDSFNWSDDEVYTYAQADRNGNYELPDPLVRGETYSMLVGAQGYVPVAEDGVTVPTDTESPYQLDVELSSNW